jgi:hypothetical protein
MAETISLDGRTLVGVANDADGEVSGDTRFHFEQDGTRIQAQYAGGEIVAGYLVGTLEGNQWDIRYVQMNDNGETATGHSQGELTVLDDGRIRVEDEWEWESKPGTGESVLEEIA